eukprot:COSAG01_NODE_1902_length_8963_cov_29.997405_2_plen_193_part_00
MACWVLTQILQLRFSSGVVYATDESQHLTALQGSSGQELWRSRWGWGRGGGAIVNLAGWAGPTALSPSRSLFSRAVAYVEQPPEQPDLPNDEADASQQQASVHTANDDAMSSSLASPPRGPPTPAAAGAGHGGGAAGVTNTADDSPPFGTPSSPPAGLLRAGARTATAKTPKDWDGVQPYEAELTAARKLQV